MSYELVKECVSRGMEFLDKHFPGHDKTVDLDEMSVGSSYTCPLAQAARAHLGETDFFDYGDALDYVDDELHIQGRGYEDQYEGMRWDEAHGFMPYADPTDRYTEAWANAYRERMSTDA